MTSTWCLAKHVFVVSRNLDTFFVWSDLGGGGGILRQNLKIYSKINSKTNIFSSKLQWNKKQNKKSECILVDVYIILSTKMIKRAEKIQVKKCF